MQNLIGIAFIIFLSVLGSFERDLRAQEACKFYSELALNSEADMDLALKFGECLNFELNILDKLASKFFKAAETALSGDLEQKVIQAKARNSKASHEHYFSVCQMQIRSRELAEIQLRLLDDIEACWALNSPDRRAECVAAGRRYHEAYEIVIRRFLNHANEIASLRIILFELEDRLATECGANS